MALVHNVDNITDLTYSALVSLVNSSGLTPGHFYKITDFKSIYIQSLTGIVMGDSTNPSKLIPLILMATGPNGLASEAQSEPTVDFPYADKWKIKYDLNIPITINVFAGIDWASVNPTQNTNIQSILNNDFGYTVSGDVNATHAFVDGQFTSDFGGTILEAEEYLAGYYTDQGGFTPPLPILTTPTLFYNSKYVWADSTSRGVIYDLEDESGNRAPFDFKNILFRRYKSQSYSSLQTWLNGLYFEFETGAHAISGDFKDMYLFTRLNGSTVIDFSNQPPTNDRPLFDNKMEPYFDTNTLVGSTEYYSQFLNNIVIYQDLGTISTANRIGGNCRYSTFNTGFDKNTLGVEIQNVQANQTFRSNRIAGYMADVTADNSFANCNIDLNMVGAIIGENFTGNTISTYCSSNQFGNNCSDNEIGTSMNGNVIGSNFSGNKIGNGFGSNTISSSFSQNVVGNYFLSNNIGPNFFDNVIGNQFQNNQSFINLDYCEFGNNVQNITFPSSSEIRYVRFRTGVSFLTMTGGAFSGFGSTPVSVDIIVQEDGFTKMIYVGENGTFQVADPST